MARSRKLFVSALSLILGLVMFTGTDMTAKAGGSAYLDFLNGGIASITDPTIMNSSAILNATAQELNLELNTPEQEEEVSTLVMANVEKALNVRVEPSSDSEKIGKLYKDCGGTILERRDGWTRIQSGNVVGWANDKYLMFDDEAKELAAQVGIAMAEVNTQVLNVRKAPDTQAEIYGQIPQGYEAEIVSEEENGWICIDYEGQNGYVLAQYVDKGFRIDEGETLQEIKDREAAEMEAKRHKKYGEYATDEDTMMLLAALIHCEARGESYEGQVAVGAVVMNRVRSSAYPNTIYSVIYASGQFTPAQNGTLDNVLMSGKIYSSCIDAAKEALSGVSNVGDLTHFRRNNGRDGLVIGNHVFY